MIRLLSILLLCAPAQAAVLNVAVTNSTTGQLDTNTFYVVPISTNILANGGVTVRGPKLKCTINPTNLTTLQQGFYMLTNEVMAPGIIVEMPDPAADTNTYTVDQVARAGFNTFRPSGVFQIVAGTNTVISPSNGKGVVTVNVNPDGNWSGSFTGNGSALQNVAAATAAKPTLGSQPAVSVLGVDSANSFTITGITAGMVGAQPTNNVLTVLSGGNGGALSNLNLSAGASNVQVSARSEVNMAHAATGGNGTQANPWTGWTNVAQQNNTTYFFPAGHYYAQSFIFQSYPGNQLGNITVKGEAGTVLHLSGSPAALGTNGCIPAGTCLGFSSVNTNWGTVCDLNQIQIKDLIIDGLNTNAMYGVLLRMCRNVMMENILVNNVRDSAFRTEYCFVGYRSGLRVGTPDSVVNEPTTYPTNAMWEMSDTCQTLVNSWFWNMTNGVYWTNVSLSLIQNVAYESYSGWGQFITNCAHNTFVRIDAETPNAAGAKTYIEGGITGAADNSYLFCTGQAADSYVSYGTGSPVFLGPQVGGGNFSGFGTINNDLTLIAGTNSFVRIRRPTTGGNGFTSGRGTMITDSSLETTNITGQGTINAPYVVANTQFIGNGSGITNVPQSSIVGGVGSASSQSISVSPRSFSLTSNLGLFSESYTVPGFNARSGMVQTNASSGTATYGLDCPAWATNVTITTIYASPDVASMAWTNTGTSYWYDSGGEHTTATTAATPVLISGFNFTAQTLSIALNTSTNVPKYFNITMGVSTNVTTSRRCIIGAPLVLFQ